jgi:hypothetical protein
VDVGVARGTSARASARRERALGASAVKARLAAIEAEVASGTLAPEVAVENILDNALS